MHSEQAMTGSVGVLIRPMVPGDAGEVLAIYQAGLDGWPGLTRSMSARVLMASGTTR